MLLALTAMKTIKNTDIKVGMHVYPGQYQGCCEVLEVSIGAKLVELVMIQSTKVKNSNPTIGKIRIGKRINGTIKALSI